MDEPARAARGRPWSARRCSRSSARSAGEACRERKRAARDSSRAGFSGRRGSLDDRADLLPDQLGIVLPAVLVVSEDPGELDKADLAFGRKDRIGVSDHLAQEIAEHREPRGGRQRGRVAVAGKPLPGPLGRFLQEGVVRQKQPTRSRCGAPQEVVQRERGLPASRCSREQDGRLRREKLLLLPGEKQVALQPRWIGLGKQSPPFRRRRAGATSAARSPRGPSPPHLPGFASRAEDLRGRDRLVPLPRGARSRGRAHCRARSGKPRWRCRRGSPGPRRRSPCGPCAAPG